MDEEMTLTGAEIPAAQEAEPDFPEPTPEEEEEWERERRAAREAMLAPYRAIKETMADHDDLLADMLYEMTMIEIGTEDEP